MKLSHLIEKTQDHSYKDLVLLKSFQNSMDGMQPFVSGQIYAVTYGDEVSHLHVELFATAQSFGSGDNYDYTTRFNIGFSMDTNVEKLLMCQQVISLLGLNDIDMLNDAELQFINEYAGDKLINDDLLDTVIKGYSESHNAVHATHFAYHTLKGELLHLINKAFA